MREETERLRIEREAIEREKAQLIAAAKKSLAPAILDPVAAARGQFVFLPSCNFVIFSRPFFVGF